MSPQEKEKIRELLLQSRPDGVGEIYDRIGQKIYHTILGILRTETAAEEVTQRFFVKLVRNRKKAARAKNLTAYLFQMARNEAADFCRQNDAALEPLAGYENVLSYRGLRRNLESLERHRALLRALDQLPHEQREVIGMKIFQEMTFSEIAEALEIPANTAASRHRYAVENLKRIMRDLIHEY